MKRVDRTAYEEPGWRYCWFCEWRLYVTEVDLCGDTVDTYNRHLVRHGEAARVADAEAAIFRSITDPLDHL